MFEQFEPRLLLAGFEVSVDAASATPGLIGSYVNASLRGDPPPNPSQLEGWRETQIISGIRYDPNINFVTSGWGVRADVGLTGGADSDWNNFSVQWDGFVRISSGNDTRLRTLSNNGSRMWIDLNHDGVFENSLPEFIDNNWGDDSELVSAGPLSSVLNSGNVYQIRIQYEDGTGNNTMQLLEDPQPYLEQEFVYILNRARAQPADYPSLPVPGNRTTSPLAVSYQRPDSDERADGNNLSEDGLRELARDHSSDMVAAGDVGITIADPDDFLFTDKDYHHGYLAIAGNDVLSVSAGNNPFSLGNQLALEGLQNMLATTEDRARLLGLTLAGTSYAPNLEIGVGYGFLANNDPQDFWSAYTAYLPQAGSNPPTPPTDHAFLTGVVFQDRNGNARYDAFDTSNGIARYDLLEGLGDVHLTIRGGGKTFSLNTDVAGGWSQRVPVLPAGEIYTIDVSGTGFDGTSTATTEFATATNVEVDFISGRADGIVNFAGPTKTPAVSINDVRATEGNPLQFTISLSSISTIDVVVKLSLSPGDATPNDGTSGGLGDFTVVSKSVTIAAGTTSTTTQFDSIADTRPERNERYFVEITRVTGAGIRKGIGIATIVNDDGSGLVIENRTRAEGNSGTSDMLLAVSLVPAGVNTAFTVEFATADGTAQAGSDYQSVSGTLSFAAGEVTKFISVPIFGDTLEEADETFFIDLSNSTGPPLGDSGFGVGRGVATIGDDDTVPRTIAIDDAAVPEGDFGSSLAVFTVRLSAPALQTTTVAFATSNGTATAGTDYVATTGVLTFAVGETVQTISVTINGDETVEPDETFTVTLSAPTGGATLSDATAIGTIGNDDSGLGLLAIGDASVVEGDAGTRPMLFTVTVVQAVNRIMTVRYDTVSGTAQAGTDFVAQTGTLTFAPGTTQQTIAVAVIGDGVFERTESFRVVLSNPVGARLADAEGTGTIVNNENLPPTVYVGDITIPESNTGTVFAQFPVGLSQASKQSVTVVFATSSDTALDGVDFTGQSGTLTFAPGETVKLITVPVTSDAADEPDEQFFVNLLSATNAFLGDPTGVGTIVFVDPLPIDRVLDEGGPGYSQIGDWPSLTNTQAYQLDMRYNAAGSGSERATWQFAGLATGVYEVYAHWVPFVNRATNAPYSIFDGGQLRASTPVNQQLAPNDVEFAGVAWERIGVVNIATGVLTVNLTDAANGFVIADSVRILKQTATPAFVVNVVANPNVAEDASGESTAVFMVTLSTPSAQSVVVHYATADGTAGAGEDYVAQSGDLTFAPGSTVQTVSVQVQADGLREGNETFFIALTDAAGAKIGQGLGTATVLGSELAWQNAPSSLDVDGNGLITPLDALIVINELNRDGTHALPGLSATQAPDFYLDVDGDEAVSPLDALMVINHLNEPLGAAPAAADVSFGALGVLAAPAEVAQPLENATLAVNSVRLGMAAYSADQNRTPLSLASTSLRLDTALDADLDATDEESAFLPLDGQGSAADASSSHVRLTSAHDAWSDELVDAALGDVAVGDSQLALLGVGIE